MITIIDKFDKPVYQHLLPVLDCNHVLRGMVTIPVTKFVASDTIEISGRTLPVTAITFCDSSGLVNKQLAVIIFNQLGEPWNGLDGWISASEFQISRYWAIPVANPGYLRETLGLVNIFLTSEFDDCEQSIQPQQSEVQQSTELVLSAKLNVSKDRLANKYDFIEFDWVNIVKQVLNKKGLCNIDPVTIETLQSNPTFKVVCFTNSSTNGIPRIMRILALNNVTQQSYSFVFNVNSSMLFNVTLNIK